MLPEPVYIARCAEHGLHGACERCFVCNEPVEQVPMVPLDQLAPLSVDCPHCLGDGMVALPEGNAPCPVCNRSGRVFGVHALGELLTSNDLVLIGAGAWYDDGDPAYPDDIARMRRALAAVAAHLSKEER